MGFVLERDSCSRRLNHDYEERRTVMSHGACTRNVDAVFYVAAAVSFLFSGVGTVGNCLFQACCISSVVCSSISFGGRYPCDALQVPSLCLWMEMERSVFFSCGVFGSWEAFCTYDKG